jgi:hypothetical protein
LIIYGHYAGREVVVIEQWALPKLRRDSFQLHAGSTFSMANDVGDKLQLLEIIGHSGGHKIERGDHRAGFEKRIEIARLTCSICTAPRWSISGSEAADRARRALTSCER